ncbi:MAG: YHS domain-containing protein [Methanobacteriota archaeon]
MHMATDPVCGKSIDIRMWTERYMYDGMARHFCSADCRQQFVADPQKYMKQKSRLFA